MEHLIGQTIIAVGTNFITLSEWGNIYLDEIEVNHITEEPNNLSKTLPHGQES